MTLRFCGLGLFGILGIAGCNNVDCRSPNDCPFGSYCVLDVSGSRVSGSCTEDCFEHSDCPAPASFASRAICTNRGQCQVVARPPQLRVRLPEPDSLFPEATRFIQVSGEVETAAEQVTLTVAPAGSGGCAGGPPQRVRLDNEGGAFQRLPFTIDQVPIEVGTQSIRVEASVGGASRVRAVRVKVDCPACADIAIREPSTNMTVPSLILPRLSGTLEPAVPIALWRVRGGQSGVFDGRLVVGPGGRFVFERLPLFAGTNQIEVLVTGVGTGLGQARCSTFVQAAGVDRGLRVVMTWDLDASDLDLHLVGPNGRFADPLTSLSARTPQPTFGGEVLDDFDGFGPEVLRVEGLPDGIYGLLVEPVVGGGTAVLRILNAGMPLTAGPVGPRFIEADRGELWVVGTLSVRGKDISYRSLDAVLPLAAPPTAPPSAWPAFR